MNKVASMLVPCPNCQALNTVDDFDFTADVECDNCKKPFVITVEVEAVSA